MALARRTRLGLVVLAAVFAALLAGAYAFAVRAWEPRVVRPFETRYGDLAADAMEVSCYPVLSVYGSPRTEDGEIVREAQDVFRARTFSRWDGRVLAELANAVDRTLFPQDQFVGGYRVTLSFYSDHGREPFARICYDPGSDVPGEGVYLERNDCIYVMDGDQSEAIAYLGELVAQAKAGASSAPRPGEPQLWR